MEHGLKNNIKAITNFIFLEDKKVRGDLIIVPGSSQDQLSKMATRLYKKGFASKIIFVGGFNRKINKKEAVFGREIAIKYGVNGKDIYISNFSSNSKENAIEALKVIKEYGLKYQKILLVCKTYHSRRIKMTFAKLFLKSEIIVVPTRDYRNITSKNWWKNKNKIKVVMSEIKKIGMYYSKGDLSIY